jgi:2-polyprenyl-6-hydroxyphenyl methylase/3-demethylubiquinone-9 3-methyltransferase
MSSGRALDVGCGLGEFMAQLREVGFDVNGIDGEAEQVRQVRQAGFEARVINFENPLPVVDASFDLITCLEVIEHVALAENFLKEMSRVLTVNGYIVLSTPNFSCWQNRIRYLFGIGPVNEGIHLRFFTQRRLEEAMMKAGLKIVGRASFGPFTGLNLLLRKFGRQPKNWIVPRSIEGMFAEHLVYLGKKMR